MRILKFTLLILGVLFFVDSDAQLTTQKKYATGLQSISTPKMLDLSTNGFIITNFCFGNFNANIPNSTIIIRLNQNYDTVWVKRIPLFYLNDLIYTSNNEIILVGQKNTILNNNGDNNYGIQLLKLDLLGNVNISKYHYLGTSNSSNSTFLNSHSSIVETNSNNFIFSVSTNFTSITARLNVMKLNTFLQVLNQKKYDSSSDYYDILRRQKILKINENQFIISYNDDGFTFYYGFGINMCICIDSSLNNTINKKFIDSSLALGNIFKGSGSTAYLSGNINSNKLVSNQFDSNFYTNNFISKFTISNDSINFLKRLQLKSTYSPKLTSANIKFYYYDGYLYASSSNDSYNTTFNIHDSINKNFRVLQIKLDTTFQTKWSKRLHLFGSNDTTDFGIEYIGNNNINLQKNCLIFKGNKIVTCAYQSNGLYSNQQANNINDNSFLITSVDTSGENAICNNTSESLITLIDSIKMVSLPTFTPSAGNISFVDNDISILNIPLINITNNCLAPKKATSKFDWYPLNSNGFNQIVCKDYKLNLYDLSYNEPKCWHWIFPPQVNTVELDSLYLPNVRSISFNQAGVFPIKLIVSNDLGYDTSVKYINVINFIPQPNLGNDTLLCAGDTLKIIYQNPPNSLHNFSGPNIYTESDTLKVFESGEYVIAAYTACGYLYDTINVNFASKPTANFTFATTCNSLAVAFTDSSLLNTNPSITYQYAVKPALAAAAAFTNYSTTPSHTYTFPSYDSFDIRLIVTSPLACVAKDTVIKRVVLKAKPTAGFGYTNNCGSLQANITSNAGIAAGSITMQEYYLGNTLISTGASPAYTFAAYGSYAIKHVTKSNVGCISDTAFVPVIINDKPSLSLSAIRDSLCLGSSYTITANATVAASTITNYTWLRNGTIQPIATNQLTDNQTTGTYTYKVIATAANTCKSDTATKIITVVSKPTANLTATNNCGSKAINILSTANVTNDNITSYFIDYGDNNTATTNPNNTIYTYSNYGSYTLKFVAKSGIGCASDTFFQTINVKDKPSLNLITLKDSVCNNNSFTITANAPVTASSIINYTWLRNGILLPNNNNQLTDNQPTGTYTYKVIATAANTCKSDTATKIITVVSKPTATFNATNNCGSKAINILSTAGVTNDNITSYFIDYGDNNTATTNPNNTVYTYSNYGSYTLKFVAKSSVGCASDTAVFSIVVKDKPTLSITYNNNACDTTNFTLSATATLAASTITNYTWVRNGTVLPNNTNTITQNNVANNYTYKLVATAATGCPSDTATQLVTVQQYPKAIFTATNGCVNKPITITNNSVNNNTNNALQYVWTTNNGLTDNSTLPTFAFATSGTKTIQLKTTTTNGCADSLQNSLTIDDYPTAAFTITEACLGKPISIANNSTGNIATYNWTTNNGLSDNNILPNFTFNTIGNYTINLQVATANNCTSNMAQSTNIQAVQLNTTPAKDTNVVVGQAVQLQVSGAATYTWQPSLQLNNAIVSNPIFTASTAGIYPLQITGTTAQGCKGSASLKINVYTANNYVWVPNAFSPNGDGLNDRLRLTCSGLQRLSNFSIFNRYGELIYLQNSCNGTGWDGAYKGKPQPIGAFIYTWAGIDFKGKAVSGKGSVVLVR